MVRTCSTGLFSRGTDRSPFRRASGKLQQPTQHEPSGVNASKLYLVSVISFGVPQSFSNQFMRHEMRKVGNRCPVVGQTGGASWCPQVSAWLGFSCDFASIHAAPPRKTCIGVLSVFTLGRFSSFKTENLK